MGLSVPSTQPDIVAIDVANMAFRAAFRFEKYRTPQGRFSGHIFGSFRMINGYRKQFERSGKKVQLWFALEGHGLLRSRILPGYKANRPHDRTETPRMLQEVYDLVRAFPGVTWQHPHLEADDVLSRMTHPSILKGRRIVIVTQDHDLWQLLDNPAVSVWCKDHLVDKVHLVAQYGLDSPRAVALYKTLFGDAVDNIPAAAPHLVKAQILEAINTHGITHPAGLYEYLHGAHGLTKQAAAKLLDHWKNVERNWKVVRLRRKGSMAPKRIAGADNPGPLLGLLKTFACNSLLRDAEQLWR